ncbi:coenzyme F420-reducing hydrogenase subunit beta [Methanobrevibacter cuticularis]|uniref:Coenzyme F420-reducing hydrogenase subunit beta n=1 Tax=Methanobrevibacter cuticularis TaxID=47311 RepID=A0A166FCR3_9EURY|nr:Coenzyme F420 hydrogenase/dehydrogenase, beta subunit C-terminal domain [Methanobrevibacter cuticularis]KZX17543.1 coenzyme F420-reducing hydrogenase subunit beta [Methanobrevibacter cuticularis]
MEFNNKTAMVGTPCQILAATKINSYSEETGGSPIDIKIGLFCMENFSYTYLKMFLDEKKIDLKDVKEFRIENNMFKIFLTNGKEKDYTIAETDSFKRRNCEICVDFTSDLSDISVGSVGSPKGFSTLIIRTSKGKKIVEGAISENYISSEPITEKGKKLLEKIASKKKKENLNYITSRENISHPVLYERKVTDDIINELAIQSQFENLDKDVISEGACVLCGACEFVCPSDIIQINERKPVRKGNCPEDCHACYFACPRTFLSENIRSHDLNSKPLGDYLEILTAKSKNVTGQDGGVVTSILLYLLNKGLVDEVFVVGEEKKNPWKPIARLTNDTEEVLNAAGTKYSTVPVAFKALKSKNSS